MIEEFDYIIVGAGSAGCAVAARLSEDGKNTVLLLEAGGRDTNPWIHIPVGFGKTFVNKALTWRFSTQPVPGLDGRSIFTPSGRVLGGSSSINGLVYARGQREDFDSWRQDGNPGWGYDDVLPYFRKSQNQQRGESMFHGVGGGLGVSDMGDPNPLADAFLASAQSLGHKRNDDFNGGTQEGVGAFQMTARNGRRSSSAMAFLRGAHGRANLAVKTGAEIERLIVDGRRVIGVLYARGSETHQARARRLVVLSAGGINTPAILQRSGIGRGAWLSDAGINVLHELPGVGDNLHDHVQARLVMRSRRLPTLNTRTRSLYQMGIMGLRYALLRRGPLASSGAQVGGFLRSRPEFDRPDVLAMFMPFSSTDYRKGLDPFAGFSISVFQLRPESRGTVRVRSADRHVPPEIQPNYLHAEKDRRALLDGLRLARRIAATEPLRQEIEREERPGLDVESDDEMLSFIRSTAGSVYHPVGTSRMGSGANAVVDAKLRVHGLEGLAIADASIMPSIVSAPTNATSIMIGEKAADLIREH
jgi:choline dehydrogenase